MNVQCHQIETTKQTRSNGRDHIPGVQPGEDHNDTRLWRHRTRPRHQPAPRPDDGRWGHGREPADHRGIALLPGHHMCASRCKRPNQYGALMSTVGPSH